MTITARSLEFIDSTPLYEAEDWEGLRRREREEGYLFFKQLLPKEPLRELRMQMLEVVERYGWLSKTEPKNKGCLDMDAVNAVPEEAVRLDIGVPFKAYEDVQRLEAFHRLPHHPNLLKLYEGIFGEPVLVHARHIARMVTPHPAMEPTPQHQDFPLIQGTSNTWTCWFPLSDCPRDLGGLTVLRQSDRLGYVPIQSALGAGNISAQLCTGEDTWVEGDYEMGDVLTFPAYTIHRALRSNYKDRIRLSLDVRYQPLSEDIEYRSLESHCDLSWEQIYADWEEEDLKYYWRKYGLKTSPWDNRLMQPSRRIC